MVVVMVLQEPYVINNKAIFNLNSKILHHKANRIYTASIMLNNNLSFQLVETFSTEFATTITVSTLCTQIVISNSYIHPNSLNDSHIKFIEKMLHDFNKYPIVNCGDFNSRSPVWFDVLTNLEWLQIQKSIRKLFIIIVPKPIVTPV